MRRTAILTTACVFVLLCASRQVSSSDAPAAATDKIGQLRVKYLDLVNEQIKSWSEDELESNIREIEIAIADKQAVKLLEQVEDTLTQLKEEFPDTPSAKTATNLLNVLRGGGPFRGLASPFRGDVWEK